MQVELKCITYRIYILDAKPRAGVVAAYDTAGHFLSMVGRRGQGPMEYIGGSDFDVDTDGNVYLLDSGKHLLHGRTDRPRGTNGAGDSDDRVKEEVVH